MAADPQTPSREDPRLGQYLIRERLGQGGMGVVYQAWDVTLEREVALKVLPGRVHLDPERRARFLREARAAARLNHPNIATVYEVGDAELPEGGLDPVPADEPHVMVRTPEPESVLYIAMELVPGQDLEQRLAAGPLPEPEALDVVLQVLDGLDAAHRAGVVHRDLKPQNLRVTPDGRVKILDFGLAKVLREPGTTAESRPEGRTAFMTREGMILGTAPYMSPEQVQGGPLDARSDLFSLGVLLYRMVTGELPFDGDSLVSYVRSLVHSEPRPLAEIDADLSPGLQAVVGRLLAREPDERYATAAQVRDDLEDLASLVGRERSRVRYVDVPVDGSETPSGPSGVSGGRRPSWGRRTLRRRLSRRKRLRWRKRLIGLAAAAAVLALALAAWWLTREPAGPAATNVAVLPFENQTDDPSLNAYYEGMSTSLIRKLSRVPGVNVISELDVRRYRDSDKTMEEIAAELGVGTMILGYVQGVADRIEVHVEGTSTIPYRPLWADSFDGRPQDLLRLQGQIVDLVLRRIPVSISRRERRLLRQNPTESSVAWDAYFRGSALLEQVGDPGSLRKAAEELQAAVEADPGFAWAHAGLSEAHWRLYRAQPEREVLDQAAESAARAVELEPEAPAMWVARARVLREQGNFGASLAALDEALRLNPLFDTAYLERAHTAWSSGDPELAEKSFRRALEVRPTFWQHWNELGTFLLRNARYDEAQEALETARDLAPEGVRRPLDNLVSVALSRNDPEAALGYFEQMPDLDDTPHLLYQMAVLRYFQGEEREALRTLDRAIRGDAGNPAYLAFAGDLHGGLGEPGPARDRYGQALAAVDGLLVNVADDANLLALRAYLLARRDRCGDSRATVSSLRSGGAVPLEHEIYLARALVVCGDRAEARRVVSELVAGGASADRLRQETELRDLL